MKPWRPRSYRYAEEQQLIERWLGLVAEAGRTRCGLAFEVAECAASSRATARQHRAARPNFLAIVDALVENPDTADPRQQAARGPQGARAALADRKARRWAQASASRLCGSAGRRT